MPIVEEQLALLSGSIYFKTLDLWLLPGPDGREKQAFNGIYDTKWTELILCDAL